MASIVSAGTTSATALNMSADTSGVLQLASNNGVVALTIDTSQVATFAGNTKFPTLQVGTNPAGVSVGVIGIPNQKRIYGRNTANTADVNMMYINGSDALVFGPGDNASIDSSGTFVQNGVRRSQGGVVTTNNVFSIPASSNTRVQVVLSNYSMTKFRIYGLRTNGGNSVCFWEGLLNNNFNTSFTNATSTLLNGGGNISMTVNSPSSGVWNFDFSNAGSGGTGFYDKQDYDVGTVTVTTY